MHPTQYNKLCELMRVRVGKPEPTWNGVPVVLDRKMPEGGWFIVPEGESSDVRIEYTPAKATLDEDDDG